MHCSAGYSRDRVWHIAAAHASLSTRVPLHDVRAGVCCFLLAVGAGTILCGGECCASRTWYGARSSKPTPHRHPWRPGAAHADGGIVQWHWRH